MAIANSIEQMFGGELPFRVEAYDGSSAGPAASDMILRIKSPEAIARVLARPGELGLALRLRGGRP